LVTQEKVTRALKAHESSCSDPSTIAPGNLSIFPGCCRSYGADECVLEIYD
jgi:hypothetical protein